MNTDLRGGLLVLLLLAGACVPEEAAPAQLLQRSNGAETGVVDVAVVDVAVVDVAVADVAVADVAVADVAVANVGGDLFDAARDATRADAPVSDGAPTDAPPGEAGPAGCGAITFVGCCDGETLWYCDDGALRHVSCASRPSCGWSASGYYDCNTTGGSAPGTGFGRSCAPLVDGSVPATDGGGDALDPCGGVPYEGCCDGNQLKYCVDGVLEVIDCALNPSCGWYGAGRRYDCGTAGLADPSATFPRECPALVVDDSGVDAPPLPEPPNVSADLAGEGGGGGGDGCSCAASGAASAAAAWWLIMLLGLLALPSRRGLREVERPRRRRRGTGDGGGDQIV